jgi:Protein of unknown function (DUF3987)
MAHEQFDWVEYAEAVAADIFGACNEEMSRAPEDVRFGSHGSVAINFKSGQWYDFENELGGGIKELIHVYKKIEDRDAAIVYAEQCRENFENGERPRPNGNAGNGPHYQQEVEATYSYHDASSQVAFEVVRFVFKQVGGGYVTDARGKRMKTFRQRRPSGESDQSWLWSLEAGEFMRPAPGKNWVRFDAAKYEQYPAGKERKVFNSAAPVIPFRLPELLAALAGGQTICVAEGEKKVDRIRDWGFPATCCAEGAKKWRAEHTAFLQGADIVLLPDNDPSGREHVELIAESLAPIARRLRILELPNLPEKGDVVDWHAAGGTAEEFARLVAAAPEYIRSESAEPQPLMRPLPPPEPFPLDALGPDLARAAQAIRDFVQSPLEMCAGAVLASTSFAVSAHVNIVLPTGQMKPTSSWFWCVAESGERKTATDDQAFAPQKQHEKQLRTRHKVELEDYEVRRKMWEAQAKAIEKQFKDPGAAGSEAHQKELEKLGPAPEKPLDPLIMSSEFTFEGLVRCLNLGQPLYGIIGSEGGQFIGGHGMTEESKLRTITGLSAAWDGEPIKRVRATETVILCGRRIGMHLMVQPEVAATALNDEILTKQGFLSRILACAPEGLIGKRMHKSPPPEAVQALREYEKRILNILETPYPLVPETRNELEPRVVVFSTEAEQLFWEFADEVEKEMAPGGEYEFIRPFAAKLPEHAARLATAIAGYRDFDITKLSREDFSCGILIAAYYAAEAKRISGSSWADPDILLAQKLLDWLLREWAKPTVSARDIYTYGPNAIRDRETTLSLAKILVDHGWLKPHKTRRHDAREWQIIRNPADEHP